MTCHFEKRKKESIYWFNKASDLMGSAAALWMADNKSVSKLGLPPSFDLRVATRCTFPLMCGLALELVYKAIITENNNSFGKTHNLVLLANLAGLKMTDKDREILKILSEVIIWDGKYPIPFDEKKMEDFGDLVENNLWERVDKQSSIKFLRSKPFSWLMFLKFWEQADEKYWSLKQKTN